MHDSQFVSNNATQITKYFQTRKGIRKLPFLQKRKNNKLEAFWGDLEICFFLSGDIILKQGLFNEYVYFIIEGLTEVVLEHHDYEYYDHK